MKYKLIPSLVAAALAAGAFPQPTSAAEPASDSVFHGVLFLPLDFYPKHREALGLSDDQMRELQRIAGEMREPAEKIEAAMQERTKALHEAIAQNPVEPGKAMERFQQVLQAENEMKMLQFRTRIAMRSVLKPGQYEKVAALAKQENASREGGPGGELQRKFQQLREAIHQRVGGGEVPRELVEKLEQIEQMAKQGRVDEARAQIEAMLGHLREDRGPRESAEGKRAGGAEMEQQMRKLHEQMERTSDPEQRERLQQQMHKMQEAQERSRGGAEAKRPEAGAPRDGENALEKHMQAIAEVAKRTDDPEKRERLEGALKGLHEALKAGNREAVEKILHAIEPVLRDATGGGAKPKKD